MSERAIKEVNREMWDDYNAIKGDSSKLDAWIDRYYSPSFIGHSQLSTDMNYEQFKQYQINLQTALPDTHLTLKQEFAEGDLVATQFTLSGTHRGEFQDLRAAGNKIQVEGAMVLRVHGNKCQEIWMYVDILDFMRRLDAIPTPVTLPK